MNLDYVGRSASPVLVSRSPNTEDAERPGCIPTQSVGTRLSAGLLSLTAMGFSPTLFLDLPKFIIFQRFSLKSPTFWECAPTNHKYTNIQNQQYTSLFLNPTLTQKTKHNADRRASELHPIQLLHEFDTACLLSVD